MALGARLQIRQSQNLTLTPQLMQSIRLLALSHVELDVFIEGELLRNPLLEREDVSGDPSERDEPDDPRDIDQPAVPQGALEDTVAHAERIKSAETIAENYDTALENVFPNEIMPGHARLVAEAAGADDIPDFEGFAANRLTLGEHLEAQAAMILRTAPDRLIAAHLVDALDPAGYLTVPLSEIAERLGAEIEDVVSVLGALQGCEPLGVFARDLAECLAIQLRERDRLDPLMARLLANLPLLGAHDWPALRRAVPCDHEDLAEMVAELRALDPRPGLAFESGPAEAVVPDVFVRQGREGWQVELNADTLPRVLVNRDYYASVTRSARGGTDKAFLVDCLQSANWLTKSLDQRAQTILKVATEIVRQQDGFLVNGIAHLRPMTLKLVADAIDMHESTVSRVTTSKYLMTPRGLFEMKYFFTQAIASATGAEDHSAEAVRHRIRSMIEAEPADAVLSDDTIAERLKRQDGIDLARRTVAKYREGMDIPSSVIRRRQKKALTTSF